MGTVFSLIREGELPGRFVWRDDVCFAILTINPITPGHTLVIPNDAIDHWLDVDEASWLHCNAVARHIGRAIDAAWDYERVAVAVAGFEVPHMHIHVMGADSMADMSFARAEQDPDPARLDGDAGRLRAALRQAGHAAVADD